MTTITLVPATASAPKSRARLFAFLQPPASPLSGNRFSAGADAVKEHGTTLPQALLDSVTRNKVALKGPITTPIGKGFTSVNVGLRKALDLYANLRPVWNLPSVPSRFSGVDLVIVRENTEDLYAGLEHMVVPGVVESLKIITASASTRIARVRVRVRAPARPQERHRHAQGQHHEAQRWPVPRVRAQRRRRSIPISHSTIASSTPRACTW